MYINNELRDIVYRNNLKHKFWENHRDYMKFIQNVIGEVEETYAELMHHEPTEVYYKPEKPEKPEGAPTELADVIIFILDYFGGNGIDIDEDFLEEPDVYYKNEEWYEEIRKEKKPDEYFLLIREKCNNHLSLSSADYYLHGNESFIAANGEEVGVVKELHIVIKLILEFCEIYGIDMEKELIKKIEYNNSRPIGYRQIGDGLLETDYNKVYNELLKMGHGYYKLIDDILKERERLNNEVLKKREERKKLFSDDEPR